MKDQSRLIHDVLESVRVMQREQLGGELRVRLRLAERMELGQKELIALLDDWANQLTETLQ